MIVVVNGTTSDLGNSSVTGGAISATTDSTTGTWTVTIADFPINQTVEGWVIDTSNVAGYTSLGADWKPTKTGSPYTVKFTIDKNGKLTKIGV